jgi:predicted DNA binding CopG/RHH family protein
LNVILIALKGDDGIKTVTLRLSDDLHKQMKLLTVQKELTIQDYIVQLIEKDLKQYSSDEQTK